MRKEPWAIFRELILNGYVTVPSDAASIAPRVYRAFDTLVDFATENISWVESFNSEGIGWKIRQGLDYSGAFAPAYKDNRGVCGKDNKVSYQSCPGFWAELKCAGFDSYPAKVEALDMELLDAIDLVREKMWPIGRALIELEPSLEHRLLNRNGTANLTIRVIRYSPANGNLAAQPHVDRSALTCVLDSSDPLSTPTLAFAKPWLSTLRLSNFRAVQADNENKILPRAVVFPGEGFARLGFEAVPPTPHTVFPLASSANRYSLVAHWMVRGLDLSGPETELRLLPTHDDNAPAIAAA